MLATLSRFRPCHRELICLSFSLVVVGAVMCGETECCARKESNEHRSDGTFVKVSVYLKLWEKLNFLGQVRCLSARWSVCPGTWGSSWFPGVFVLAVSCLITCHAALWPLEPMAVAFFAPLSFLSLLAEAGEPFLSLYFLSSVLQVLSPRPLQLVHQES